MVFNGVIRSVSGLRTVLQSVVFVPFLYTVFFNMIPTFLVAWENATRLQERFNDNFRGRGNTYDFIVVGGGTAGSVVAHRLSELYSVLLIEAGGPANPLALIPALTLPLRNRRQTDWRYKTVPQSRACLNSINQECLISGGRALGGSSTLDGLAFLRGHSADFDNWARVTGDQRWSYQSLLPFFRRSEEFIGTSTNAPARGRDGELRVREPDFLGLGEEWVRAGREMGHPTLDLNGQHGQGFSILQYPLRRGMRQSTDSAFILPIRLSPRLRILSYTVANRILFRDMTNMAYGVEYERFGRTELAVARREVIISAGALSSPALLMRSGVGPREHLMQLGIPLRSDLPVGRNLQDHLGVTLGPFFFTPPPGRPSSRSFIQDRDFTPGNIISWITTGRGPLSTTGLQGAGALSSVPAVARGESSWPDLLLLLNGQGIHSTFPATYATAHSLQEDELSRYYSGAEGRDAFHVIVVGARPSSSGTLRLSSTNPRDLPIVNPGYLSDPASADIRILTEGVMAALALVENTTTFRSGRTSLGPNLLPGCESHLTRTMGYWDCYIQRFSTSMSSPVGTVGIGSVLDGDLKVRGTRGLRVIDASVMPSIVSRGTLATTVMIGERGADFILREHASNSTSSSLTGALSSAVFGRNGLLVRNPIQRFLAQEFDRMNPLPSLFRMNSTDFNPFSRFLGLFTPGASLPLGQQGAGGILGSIFATVNQQTSSLLSALLGGAAAANATGLRAQARPPVTPPARLRPVFPLGNFLQQLGGAGNQGVNNTSSNNLFDIIFPVRNSTITLPNPFQDIYRNQSQPQNQNNLNLFGNLFQSRPPQQQQQPLGVSTPILTPPNRNNVSFSNGGAPNLNLFSLFGLQMPNQNPGTPSPIRFFSSITPLTSSSSAPILLATRPAAPFRISLRTTSTTPEAIIPLSDSLPVTPEPGMDLDRTTTLISTTDRPEPELSLEFPAPGNVSSTSFTLPILDGDQQNDIFSPETTTPSPEISNSPTDSGTEPQSDLGGEPPAVTNSPTESDPGELSVTSTTTSSVGDGQNPVSDTEPMIELNNNDVDLGPNMTITDSNQASIELGSGDTGGTVEGDAVNLRTIRLISREASKFRKVHEDYHPVNNQNGDLSHIHYNDNDYAPALPANFQVEQEHIPFYDYEEVAKYADKLASKGRDTNNYQNVDYGEFPISYQTSE